MLFYVHICVTVFPGMYIPLDDSLQYIAGLERKLARVRGKTRGQRQAESRRLIDALASSRDAHTQRLMESTDARADAGLEADTEHHSSAAVDPQGNAATRGPERDLVWTWHGQGLRFG